MVYPDPNRPDVLARAKSGATPYTYEPALGPNGEPGEYISVHGIRKWRPVPVFSPEEYTPPEPYPLPYALPDSLNAAQGDDAGGAGEESPLLLRGGDLGVVADADASAAGFASGFHHPPAPSSEEEGEKSRTWRSIDFTPPRRALFLHHLAEQGNVRAACSRVGISPQAAYLARRRDAVFRAGWDAALVHSREHALQVLACQALDGVREEVWHRGELVGHKVRHDARLLLAHLGRLDARCGDAQSQVRAERFDELLALVAGAEFPDHMADCADRGLDHAADPILPMEPGRYVRERGEVLLSLDEAADDEAEEADEALDREQAEILEAQACAAAELAEWDDTVARINDAIEAGDEPVVAASAEDEPPYEVKSRDGIPPRAFWRAGGAPGSGERTGARVGSEFFPRTLYRSSTCSPGAAPGAA